MGPAHAWAPGPWGPMGLGPYKCLETPASVWKRLQGVWKRLQGVWKRLQLLMNCYLVLPLLSSGWLYFFTFFPGGAFAPP